MKRNSLTEAHDNWIKTQWRNAMAWVYMTICIFDFIVLPIVWLSQQSAVQWSPMTLEAAGTFHLAMAAVLGITSWSRGKEKIAGVS